MTKRLLIVAFLSLLASPSSLTAQNPLVQSLKGTFDRTRTNADMYRYRPTDEVRSTGEMLAHIANTQFNFCSSAAREANPIRENFEETRTLKPQIIDALEESFAYCNLVFSRTNDEMTAMPATRNGQRDTVGGILAFNSAHNWEHYGNLITYMRINGIVPPSSR